MVHFHGALRFPASPIAARRRSRRSTPTSAGSARALFTVGTKDALLDDSLFMRALLARGTGTRRARDPSRRVHGFIAFSSPQAFAAIAAPDRVPERGCSARRPTQLMPPPYAGRCVCGAVQHHLTAEPFTLYASHCTIRCTVAGGSAFRLSMPVARGAAQAHRRRAGARRVHHSLGGRTRRAARCARCATWLWGEPERAPAVAILRPSTPRRPPRWVEPVAPHLGCASAQPWSAALPPARSRCDGQPDGERELVRAWRAQRPLRPSFHDGFRQ